MPNNILAKRCKAVLRDVCWGMYHNYGDGDERYVIDVEEAAECMVRILIFIHALKRAGVTAHEAIYVGDNYYADVIGSRRAGLRPVLYDPTGLFPEADCSVITSFNELIPAMNDL